MLFGELPKYDIRSDSIWTAESTETLDKFSEHILFLLENNSIAFNTNQEELCDMLEGMLCKDPEMRPDLEDVADHFWLTDFDDEPIPLENISDWNDSLDISAESVYLEMQARKDFIIKNELEKKAILR